MSSVDNGGWLMPGKQRRITGVAAVAAFGTLTLAAGCGSTPAAGNHEAKPTGSRATAPGSPSSSTSPADLKPLQGQQLRHYLLTADDLGPGYTQTETPDDMKAADPHRYDDMGVSGCPALKELGKHSDEAQFAAKTSAGFTFGADSTLGEELHSDAPSKLSAGLRRLVHAQTSCPTYTMTSGSTPLTVTVRKDDAPSPGPDVYAYTTTLTGPGGAQVLKTAAVRRSNVLVILVGAPALVDRHIEAALAKLPGS
ncbi:hypothetical protein HEK616_83110 (plasmid) [Streptomyces nigrescens]|uniref:Secreted protein n=1 Tax=Streptomyces nigrescens TaxID=1920 RepID=A0ABM8A7X8_STRNI|nr:hypothetical protein [Streptomyces nigrescens]BDM74824.1 hypothetical protein HEK616_83110 [Streptomyces nigrescens]